MYPGYQGEILINGKELGSLNPAKWREKCALMEQVPFLFEGTVRENVKLGQEVSEKKSIRSWNVLESSIWQTAWLVEKNRNCPAANVRKSRLRGRFTKCRGVDSGRADEPPGRGGKTMVDGFFVRTMNVFDRTMIPLAGSFTL